MSVYGATKDTELSKIIETSEQGEANGAVIYQALALIAREQGYAEEAEVFSEIANMEAMHAGFYAAMNAKYPQDFWELVKNIRNAEAAADGKMPAVIAKVRALGTKEALKAAEGMEFIREQENFHARILDKLIARHEGMKMSENNEIKDEHAVRADNGGVKVYVCKVCGYEYVGNLDDEPDDYVCPLCHKGKEYFEVKE